MPLPSHEHSIWGVHTTLSKYISLRNPRKSPICTFGIFYITAPTLVVHWIINTMSPSIDIDGQTPPFRAEHIGSYLRSSSLLQRRKDFAAKLCTYEELRAVEDESIKHVVQLQRQAGIKSITDGEQRRCAT